MIGTRAMIKALLLALVEPTAKLRELEQAGDFTGRLAMLEELKTMPSGAVWDYYCLQHEVPVGPAWLDAVRKYEREVQSKRNLLTNRAETARTQDPSRRCPVGS